MPISARRHKVKRYTQPRTGYDYLPHRVESRAFYMGPQWRALRVLKLGASPTCEACRERTATVVDHIEPRRKRPELSYEMGNLQSLCTSCHNAKTRMEQLGGRHVASGQGDGWGRSL